MAVVKINRDGKEVSVQEHLIGKRQEHSLCWQGCKKFKPQNVINCKVAQDLFIYALSNGIRTAVWECTSYEPKQKKEL